MDRRKRIEYLVTTMRVLVTGFVIYGLLGSLEPLIHNNKLKSFLLFGLLGGLGFSMVVSSIILSARFFSKRKLGFKIVAAILWPITFARVVYAGIFIYIPYQIYNIVKIIVETRKNDKGGELMRNLIYSHDNSIEPNGAIGIQKCGIIFWQKTGFLRHCNELSFRS